MTICLKRWPNTLFAFLLMILVLPTASLYSQENKIRIIKENATLRVKPEIDATIIRNLPLGAILDVEQLEGQWVKVKLPPTNDGIVITGYVQVPFVSFETRPRVLEPKVEIEPAKIKDDRQLAWKNDLATARSKRSTGLIVALTGAAVLIPCAILTFADKTQELGLTYSSITYEENVKTAYIIGDAVGLVAIVAGLSIHSSAGQRITRLEEEGRNAGYFSVGLSAKYRAIGLNIGISF